MYVLRYNWWKSSLHEVPHELFINDLCCSSTILLKHTCNTCTCALYIVGGSDYGFFPTPVFLGVTVILADEMSVRYAIPIPDDDIVESVETFTARCAHA